MGASMTTAENEATPAKPAAKSRPGRGRRILVNALIVLAALMLFIAAWATLVTQGILNPDKWSETSKELLENDEVRAGVSTYVVGQLYYPEAVAQQLEGALPPAAAGLSSAIASGLDRVAIEAVDRVLARPRVVDVWAAANKATMEAVDRLIDNKGEFVSLQGNEVVLDVRTLLAEVGAQLGGSGQLVDRIPPDAGQIVVLQSDQLGALQKIIKALRTISFWFAIGGGVLFGLAVYLARGRRREALRSVSISLIVVALLVLVLRRFVGDGVIDSLVSDATYKAAALGTWAIATEALKAAALGADRARAHRRARDGAARPGPLGGLHAAPARPARRRPPLDRLRGRPARRPALPALVSLATDELGPGGRRDGDPRRRLRSPRASVRSRAPRGEPARQGSPRDADRRLAEHIGGQRRAGRGTSPPVGG